MVALYELDDEILDSRIDQLHRFRWKPLLDGLVVFLTQ